MSAPSLQCFSSPLTDSWKGESGHPRSQLAPCGSEFCVRAACFRAADLGHSGEKNAKPSICEWHVKSRMHVNLPSGISVSESEKSGMNWAKTNRFRVRRPHWHAWKSRGSRTTGALLGPFREETHQYEKPRANLNFYWVEKKYAKLKKQDLFCYLNFTSTMIYISDPWCWGGQGSPWKPKYWGKVLDQS